ncbi:hypothetical protein ANN_12826 [Periplaneta americana]|uniref:Uncharacterized protein n=1 Tax=Periplaneta americana TaxID=6978 RepID=A0ABQ8TJT7_PERAM|nr:hypothetical protein ANN_12826 [Periplaneta americana]
MAGLCEGGNEPVGSLKAICKSMIAGLDHNFHQGKEVVGGSVQFSKSSRDWIYKKKYEKKTFEGRVQIRGHRWPVHALDIFPLKILAHQVGFMRMKCGPTAPQKSHTCRSNTSSLYLWAFTVPAAEMFSSVCERLRSVSDLLPDVRLFYLSKQGPDSSQAIVLAMPHNRIAQRRADWLYHVPPKRNELGNHPAEATLLLVLSVVRPPKVG